MDNAKGFEYNSLFYLGTDRRSATTPDHKEKPDLPAEGKPLLLKEKLNRKWLVIG